MYGAGFQLIQKQPREVFYKKSCSSAFRNIHRNTPVLEFIFDKVAGLKASIGYEAGSQIEGTDPF